jgi:hypothetical protein
MTCRRTPQRRAALKKRLERALQDLYHNASPCYPTTRNDYEWDLFWRWFEDLACSEIEYLNELHACIMPPAQHVTTAGRTYRRFKYGLWYGSLDHVARFQQRYGPFYQWGRGGRTLAPAAAITQRGGSSFWVNAGLGEEYSPAAMTELILQLEAFNEYVRRWNTGIPAQWSDHVAAHALEEEIAAHDGKQKRLRTVVEWV